MWVVAVSVKKMDESPSSLVLVVAIAEGGALVGGFVAQEIEHAASVFFFQAEDGIRGLIVTGVQTCALPIWSLWPSASCSRRFCCRVPASSRALRMATRSEERRGGKECRSRWSPYHEKKKTRFKKIRWRRPESLTNGSKTAEPMLKP